MSKFTAQEDLIIKTLYPELGGTKTTSVCNSVCGQDRTIHSVKDRWLNALRQDVEKERKVTSMVEDLKETMGAAMLKLPKLAAYKVPKASGKGDKTIITNMISDTHVGSFVSAEETAGLGDYNFKKFEQRVNRMFDRVLHNTRNTHFNVERFDVDFLGDIVDGVTIFKNHEAHTDMPVPQQIIMASEYFSRYIRDLAGVFPLVRVNCIVGNHGRIGRFGESKHPNNIEFLLYEMMRMRLDIAGVKNIEWNISPTWWTVVKRFDKHFYLAHGDDFRAWLDIPFYGALRYKQRVNELVRTSYKNAPYLDYFEVGHHHLPAEFSGVLMNGNMVGASEFSAKLLQSGGMPKQKLFFTHPHYGKGFSMDIMLEDPKNLPEMPIS